MTDRSETLSRAEPTALATRLRTDARHGGTPRTGGTDRPRARTHPSRTPGLSIVEVMALVLSLLWLGLVGWFFLTIEPEQARVSRGDPLGFMMAILGVFLPVALIWVAASAARTARTMREESARLQGAIDAMRLSYVEQQREGTAALRRAVEERIEKVSRAQAVLGAEVAALQKEAPPAPVIAPPARPEPSEPRLALDTGPEIEPLPPEDFIRALDFPANERDVEGFRVLRAALEHHQTAQLVTAGQDLLTLLAQDGIYMDDLTVHRAEPALWRAFARGIHGPEVAALGGIRDRSSLALTTGRMKDDPVFRDAVHHFLRTFDRVYPTFAERATDAELMRFANTRTARAFMLTARVAGTFT
ncbi:hypothetical protein MWU52_16800 [Jannaschia sp. S6380]|uniref:hypothetical protein n=1 Tax=Jannaschia sp. S6380 TaxID=2926408 RepID=UPI001FF61D85|nr:hypothetical protein [Jannaschia sp. S6380]MCK0169215.1 hypothetical protein [Jannaschia sp. S6380]